jgi:hypothetical protein
VEAGKLGGRCLRLPACVRKPRPSWEGSTAAPQHRSTAAPQHRSTAAPQHRSTAAPQHRSTAAPQHRSMAVGARGRCGLAGARAAGRRASAGEHSPWPLWLTAGTRAAGRWRRIARGTGWRGRWTSRTGATSAATPPAACASPPSDTSFTAARSSAPATRLCRLPPALLPALATLPPSSPLPQALCRAPPCAMRHHLCAHALTLMRGGAARQHPASQVPGRRRRMQPPGGNTHTRARTHTHTHTHTHE